MPTPNAAVQFKAGLNANYVAIATKDENTLYFSTDTNQFYVGSSEYTRPVRSGAGAPSSTTGIPTGSMYYDTTNHELYALLGDTWTKVSNLWTYTHPTTTATSAAAVKVGKDSSGHVVIGSALAKGDVGLGNVTNNKQVKAINSSTDDHIVAFSGTSGDTIKDTGETVATLKTYADTAASTAASGKADQATTLSGYGITDAKIASGTITLGSNTITPLTSGSTLSAAKLSGAIPSAVTATTQTAGDNSTKIATTAFVTSAISASFGANDAMLFKGTIGSSGATITELPATHSQGWTYKVATAGTYAGKVCEVGDMIICVTDGTTANNDHWTVVQTNIDGAVTGPSSSTDAHVATFNGTTGKVIKDSGYTIGKSVPSNAVFTDTKVTLPENHYTPATVTGQDKTASASGATAAWSIDVVKGVTLNTDGKGHVTGLSVTSGKLPANPNINTTYTLSGAASGDTWVTTLTPSSGSATTSTVPTMGAATANAAGSAGLVPAPSSGKNTSFLRGDGTWVVPDDTKVTLPANHYTPTTATGQDKSASATGATAAWGIDVVKGVTLNTDGRGHVTGISVTSGKIPTNPNTDTKVNVISRGTTKAYLLGTITSPTSSAQAITSVAETGVYFDTTAATLVATTFKGALTGNASTATKATQDASGNVITTTYATKEELTNTVAAAISWGEF